MNNIVADCLIINWKIRQRFISIMRDPQAVWVCVKEGFVGVVKLMLCLFPENKCGKTIHMSNLETLSEMAGYN